MAKERPATQQVTTVIPDDPEFRQAWAEAGPKPLVQTAPSGADVYIRELGTAAGAEGRLGHHTNAVDQS